ncbi:MAG: hypothetical protein ACUVQ2_00945 [Dissulfurimicrobium sp.]|uniref:hypothetical protein n=1 Tax=Dissulfurimicrobium sp. TaxID=2022436 RepID=UPI0040497FC3
MEMLWKDAMALHILIIGFQGAAYRLSVAAYTNMALRKLMEHLISVGRLRIIGCGGIFSDIAQEGYIMDMAHIFWLPTEWCIQPNA